MNVVEFNELRSRPFISYFMLVATVTAASSGFAGYLPNPPAKPPTSHTLVLLAQPVATQLATAANSAAGDPGYRLAATEETAPFTDADLPRRFKTTI